VFCCSVDDIVSLNVWESTICDFESGHSIKCLNGLWPGVMSLYLFKNNHEESFYIVVLYEHLRMLRILMCCFKSQMFQGQDEPIKITSGEHLSAFSKSRFFKRPHCKLYFPRNCKEKDAPSIKSSYSRSR
jgi:hypothetical protein